MTKSQAKPAIAAVNELFSKSPEPTKNFVPVTMVGRLENETREISGKINDVLARAACDTHASGGLFVGQATSQTMRRAAELTLQNCRCSRGLSNVHDFEDKTLGKVAPYGVYDVIANEGWVSVGITTDTAEFAVASIRCWFERMGRRRYPQAKELTITADCGGSNGARVRLWKVELQRLADETGLTIHVHQYPPGTSKWNKIEHRLFCYITQNWRGRPLTDRLAVVEPIGATTTKTGLKVECALDPGAYEKGVKVSDADMASINLTADAFHPEWNYSIRPHS